MKYTPKIQHAIRFATKTHEGYQKQKRIGKDVPYIVHPLAVGLILATANAEEELIIAGILHDTIEDSIDEKKVTKEMIVTRFGEKVYELVLSVTEQDKELSWEERKAEALEHIKTFSHNSLLLKSADVIANNMELIDDYNKYSEKTFERFNAPKEKTIPHTLKVINAIIEQWSESPLAPELLYIAKELMTINQSNFMSQSPAKIISYSDYNEDMPLECPACNWKGTPKSSDWINTDSDYCLDVSCPICEKMLLVAEYAIAN